MFINHYTRAESFPEKSLRTFRQSLRVSCGFGRRARGGVVPATWILRERRRQTYSRTRRSRSAFAITEIELMLIVIPASIGLSVQPSSG